MDHHTAPEIQLRADGSIDIEHYLRIAHQMRSDQAHHLAAQVTPDPKTVLGLIARLGKAFMRKPLQRSQQGT